eukprot:COSAG05_NODE_913_length_6630_cov_20.525566_6_plen_74_part_00
MAKKSKDPVADVEAAKRLAKDGADTARKAAIHGAEVGRVETKKKMGYLVRVQHVRRWMYDALTIVIAGQRYKR